MSALETIHLEGHADHSEDIEKYFSEIGQVDATAIAPGEMKHFGVAILPLVLLPRAMVEKLLRAEKIQTYQKLSVDLEMENEEDNHQFYTAYFSASQKIDEVTKKDYRFAVKISKVTGEVDVISI